MKSLKLIFLFIFFNSELFALPFNIIPIFFDKNSQKLLGLFMHKSDMPSEEWSKIILYNTTHNKVVDDAENMFGELYNKLGLHDPFDLMAERALTYFFPAKNFISAEMLNNYTNNIGGDGFIWLDMDELSKQDKNSPHYFMLDGKKYIIDKEGNTGFPYHFNLGWMNRGSWVYDQRQKYVNSMQAQPSQQVTLTQGSVTTQPSKPGIPQQGLPQQKPVRVQPDTPQRPQTPEDQGGKSTNYPKDVKEEHKFFYDVYDDNYNSLIKNIESAKQAGNINFQRAYRGINETALTVALDRARPNINIIQTLLANGIDVNAKNGIQQSPLKIAIIQNAPEEIIKLLLDYGANPNEVVRVFIPGGEPKEISIIDFAQKPEIKKLLQDYSENPVAAKQPSQQPVVQTQPNNLMNSLQQLSNSLNALQQML